MIKEQFFPTMIYGKDVKLNNQLFANEIIEWSKRDPGLKKQIVMVGTLQLKCIRCLYFNLWYMNCL
jgi:hypothetical protein